MNASEAFEDLGGLPGDWWTERGAIERDCPTCHEPAGTKCTFEAEFPSPSGMKLQRRQRHSPCRARDVWPTDTGTDAPSAQEGTQSQERGTQ